MSVTVNMENIIVNMDSNKGQCGWLPILIWVRNTVIAPEGHQKICLGQQLGGDGLFSFSNCQLWATPHSM